MPIDTRKKIIHQCPRCNVATYVKLGDGCPCCDAIKQATIDAMELSSEIAEEMGEKCGLDANAVGVIQSEIWNRAQELKVTQDG